MTADHVYVLGLCKEAIPGNRRDEYPGTENEHFEEERRLFYVSLTREKCTLVLSRPNKIRTNEAAQIGVRVSKSRLIYSSLEVSPFFLDILEFLPRGVSGDTWNELVERT